MDLLKVNQLAHNLFTQSLRTMLDGALNLGLLLKWFIFGRCEGGRWVACGRRDGSVWSDWEDRPGRQVQVHRSWASASSCEFDFLEGRSASSRAECDAAYNFIQGEWGEPSPLVFFPLHDWVFWILYVDYSETIVGWFVFVFFLCCRIGLTLTLELQKGWILLPSPS